MCYLPGHLGWSQVFVAGFFMLPVSSSGGVLKAQGANQAYPYSFLLSEVQANPIMCCWKSNSSSSDSLFLSWGERALFSWILKKSPSGRWNTDAIPFFFVSVRLLFKISLDMCHQSVALWAGEAFSEEASGHDWCRWCFCLKDITGKGEITVQWLFRFSVCSQIFFFLVREEKRYKLHHVKLWDDPLPVYLQQEFCLFVELDMYVQTAQACWTVTFTA